MNSTTFFPRCKRTAVLTFLFVVVAVPTHATVYYVDAAQPNDTGDGLSWPTAMKQIQTAIDSSIAGDTLLVKYGTYSITTDLVLTSNRRITSDNGTNDSWYWAIFDEDLCIVDAGGTGRVLTITDIKVTDQTRIRGFTFTGGRATAESPGATYGGGVYIADEADPEFYYCRFTQNTATTSGTGHGGGVACVGDGTEPSFWYCTIDSNLASSSWYGQGGGIYFYDVSNGYMTHSKIRDNTASTARVGYGGGLYSAHSTLEINIMSIKNNVAATRYPGDGGGIYIYQGDVLIATSIIENNRATEGNARAGNGGGARSVGNGPIHFRHNSFRDNVASLTGDGNGGGLYLDSGYSEITDNLFEGNVAASGDGNGNGGGLYSATYGDDVVRNNEFLHNTASRRGLGRGGGIYTSCNIEIDRNIIAFNAASDSSEGYGGACFFTNLWAQVFTNNTVYRNANTASLLGSGVGSGLYHDAGGGGMTIDNNIFAGHSLEHSDSLAMYIPNPVTARYNCFYDNPAGNYNGAVTSTNETLGDPRFTEPSDTTADFSLAYDSPCIEAGDPTYPVPEDGAWVIDLGALEYAGTRHWRPVTGTGELLFGGRVKAKANVTTLGTLSEIDMVVNRLDHHPMAPVSVKRWYAIDHVGDGMTFDLVLTYLDAEVGDQDEANLSMWRWTDEFWEGPKLTSVDVAENVATVVGQTEFSDWILSDGRGPTRVRETLPPTWLLPNYPNPFNPTTTISYQLAGRSHVRLIVYNVAGRAVRVLENAERPGGYYEVVWDGRDNNGQVVASGIYFYRLTAGDFVQTRKMVLIK
jgi:hypothetical protein